MSRSVGGNLGLRELAALAGAHQIECQRVPPDREIARIAAHELRSGGLTVSDIAEALRLSDGAVRDLLSEHPSVISQD